MTVGGGLVWKQTLGPGGPELGREKIRENSHQQGSCRGELASVRARFPSEQEERGTLPLPTSRKDAEDWGFADDEPGIVEITVDSFYEWGRG